MRKRQKALAISAVGAAVIAMGLRCGEIRWNTAGQGGKGQRWWREESGNTGLDPNKTNTKKEESERKELIKLELSEQEKVLLKKISADESAIEQGRLFTWQKELVRDMREVATALEDAYPSHAFQIVDAADGRTDSGMESTFWFVADGGASRYVLYLSEKEGKRTIRDTFFGTLLSDPYEHALLSWLQKNVPECIGCQVSFDCAVGEAYTEASVRAAVQALLKGKDKLANFTELYVDGTDCEEPEALARQLEREIRQQGIYGSYEIAVLLQLPETFTVHAEPGEKADTGHVESGEKADTAYTETDAQVLEKYTEADQGSETTAEKTKRKSEKTKIIKKDFKNTIYYIDKNRNERRYVWIYTFSNFQ